MKRVNVALAILLAVSLFIVFLYYQFQFVPVALSVPFEEVDRDPKSYNRLRVAVSGYLIGSDTPMRYYLTPDLSIITDPPSAKMVLLVGGIETLRARFDIESYVAIIANFSKNEITQISSQKIIVIGEVIYVVYSWGLGLPRVFSMSYDGWSLISEHIFLYTN